MNFSYNYYQQLEDPDIYLCNPDRKQLGALILTDRNVTLRLNELSEFTATAYQYLKNANGELIGAPYYDKIQTKRLLFVDGVGWFQITKAVENDDGNEKYISITASSHEVEFKNKGFISEERVYCFFNPLDPYDNKYDSTDTGAMPSVVGQLVQQLGIAVDLHDTDPEVSSDYGEWTLVYIEPELKYIEGDSNSICRTFDEGSKFGYDFMLNDVQEAFEVVFLFDILYHTIKVKFASSITTPTNIYLSFENLINEIEVTEDADDITTVLNCSGDNLDIRTVNPMGTNYIVDFSYYMATEVDDDGDTVYPWMSKELIQALQDWQTTYDSYKDEYADTVVTLQGWYLKQDELAADIQAANLVLMDLQEVVDELMSAENNEGKTEDEKEAVRELPTYVEEVDIGDNSLDTDSEFFSKNLSGDNTYTIYNAAPELSHEATISTITATISSYEATEVGGDLEYHNYLVEVTITLSAAYAKDTNFKLKVLGKTHKGSVSSFFSVTMPAGTLEYSFSQEITIKSLFFIKSITGVVFYSSLSSSYTFTSTAVGTRAYNGYYYKYSFDGQSSAKLGTYSLSSAIQNYSIDDIDENGGTKLYFLDKDTTSYCKLLAVSETAVGKNKSGDNGISTAISDGGTLYVDLGGFTFSVTRSGTKFTIKDGNTDVMTSVSSGAEKYYGSSLYQFNVTADSYVSLTRYYISGFERFTCYAMIATREGWKAIWDNHILALNTQNDDYQDEIDNVSAKLQEIVDECSILPFIKNKGETLYNELQHYWIEGDYENEYLSTTDSTTISEKIDLANELVAAAEIELAKVCQPKFSFEVDSINFINLIQFKTFAAQLELGKTIAIEKSDDIHYTPALVEISFSLDDTETFTLGFANSLKLDDAFYTYADLISEASSVTRSVTSNWSNIMEYAKNRDSITSLIEEPLNRALRLANSNMSNQEFTIDDTGILGRRYTDDSHNDFYGEQIRIINNVILFTDDYWETAKLALGKIELSDGVTAYGLIADVLVGNLMLSKRMAIFNEGGSIKLDEDGITIANIDGDTVFKATTSGEIYVSNYTTQDESGELFETLRQEFTVADGALLSTISNSYVSNDTIKNYYTKVETDSAIEQSADSISLQVKNVETSVSNLGTRVTTCESNIKQNASNITLEVSRAEGVESELKSQIQVNANNISAKVSSSGGSNSSFGWSLTDSGFTLYSSNSTVFSCTKSGVSISGNITATSGTIGGCSISDGTLNISAANITSGTIDSARIGSLSADKITTGTLSADRISTSSSYLAHLYATAINGTTITPGPGTTTQDGYMVYKRISLSDGLVSFTNNPQTSTVTSYNGSLGFTNYNQVWLQTTGDLILHSEGTAYFGYKPTASGGARIVTSSSSGNLYGTWYGTSGTAIASDSNVKNSIETLDDRYSAFFDNLNPIRYKYNDGTSDRYHTGFIAQEVKEAIEDASLATSEVAAYIETQEKTEDDGETVTKCYIRYSELIALCVNEIQKLKARIDNIEKSVSA